MPWNFNFVAHGKAEAQTNLANQAKRLKGNLPAAVTAAIGGILEALPDAPGHETALVTRGDAPGDGEPASIVISITQRPPVGPEA